MFFPALAMTTAVWLITAPLMDTETGPLGGLSIVTGSVAWLLASLAYWSRTSQRSLAVLGVLLGVANLILPSTVGTEATCAIAAVILMIAGVAPRPGSVKTTRVVAIAPTVVSAAAR
jgi:hypothetical protein